MDALLGITGELTALAVVIWLVVYDHRVLIPRLVKDFTRSLANQSEMFTSIVERERQAYEIMAVNQWKNYAAEIRQSRRETEAQLERMLSLIREYERIQTDRENCQS